jgi:hypothetical protein
LPEAESALELKGSLIWKTKLTTDSINLVQSHGARVRLEVLDVLKPEYWLYHECLHEVRLSRLDRLNGGTYIRLHNPFEAEKVEKLENAT